MTREEFRQRYDTIDEEEYDGALSEDDFEHTRAGSRWCAPLRPRGC